MCFNEGELSCQRDGRETSGAHIPAGFFFALERPRREVLRADGPEQCEAFKLGDSADANVGEPELRVGLRGFMTTPLRSVKPWALWYVDAWAKSNGWIQRVCTCRLCCVLEEFPRSTRRRACRSLLCCPFARTRGEAVIFLCRAQLLCRGCFSGC